MAFNVESGVEGNTEWVTKLAYSKVYGFWPESLYFV